MESSPSLSPNFRARYPIKKPPPSPLAKSSRLNNLGSSKGISSKPCEQSKTATKSINVLHKLAFREVNGTLRRKLHASDRRTILFEKVPGRLNVFLEDILDINREIVSGVILLGFTKDGDHLISYTVFQVADNFADSQYIFRCQWWKFDMRKRLEKVAEAPLFSSNHDEGVRCWGQMKLTFLQSPDQALFVVHGSGTGTADESLGPRQNFISIIPSPIIGKGTQAQIVHFSYQVHHPFPDFVPSLSMYGPNVLVLNTGYGLRLVQFSINGIKRDILPFKHSDSEPMSTNDEDKENRSNQESASASQKQDEATYWATSEVPLEISTDNIFQVNSDWDISDPQTIEVVNELAFDPELYIMRIKARNPAFKDLSLVDYDLGVIQIMESDGAILMLLTATWRKEKIGLAPQKAALSQIGSQRGAQTQPSGFVFALYPRTGAVQTFRLPINANLLVNKDLNTISAAIRAKFRNQWQAPLPYSLIMFSWWNKNVLMGISLDALPHPLLPIAIRFVKPTTQQKLTLRPLYSFS